MLYGVWTTVCQFIWISSTSSKHKAGDSSCRTSKHTWQPFMLLWDTDNPIYHICLARENESGKERKRRRGEVIINSLFCSSSTWSEPRGPEALSEASKSVQYWNTWRDLDLRLWLFLLFSSSFPLTFSPSFDLTIRRWLFIICIKMPTSCH